MGPGRYPTVGVKASVLSVKHMVLYPLYGHSLRPVPSSTVDRYTEGPWHSVTVGIARSCAMLSSLPSATDCGRLSIAPW